MPDQRSVMKEFRSLDAKRAASGLTPAEEARYAHLRDLVGGETDPRPGFDVDAAAAQLRDSLLPAGFRNRPAPPAPPVEPEAEAAPEELPPAEVQPAYAGEALPPFEAAPQPDAFFDPGALAPDGSGAAYDGSAPANEAAPQAEWDPNAPYDPAAAAYDPNAAAYDPNAPYDPNAAAYDPNAAAYDPNAPAYDPNAPPYEGAQDWDPNAQATWDPNAPQEPGAPGWDAGAQPYEVGAEPHAGAEAYDDGQGYDPNAQATYDPDAPLDPNIPYDPNASPEAGVQPYPAPGAALVLEGEPFADPGTTAEFVRHAPEAPPDGWYAEASAAQPGEHGEAAPAAVDDAGLESLLPFDPEAEASIVPGEVPEGFGRALGEYDDTAAFAARHGDPSPADLPQEGADFQAAQTVSPEASEDWQPDTQLDDGFQLASGGSFDATAEAAAPEWAGGTPPPPWEGAAAAEAEPADLLGGPEVSFSTGESFEGAAASPEISLEAPAEGAGELTEPEYVEPLAAAAELGDQAGIEPEPGADAFVGMDAAAPEQAASLAPEPPPGAVGADDFALDIEEELPPDLAEPAPALDFSRPDFSAGGPSEEEAAFADAATAAPPAESGPGPSFDLSVEPAPELPTLDLGAPEDLSLEEPTPPAAAAAFMLEEEIPTIDGEEILEEIVEEVPPAGELAAGAPSEPTLPEPEPPAAVPEPPPAPLAAPEPPPPTPPAAVAPPPSAFPAIASPAPPAPQAPPAAAAAVLPEAGEADSGWLVPGSHRVVVHTVEGQVKRGVLEDVDLASGSLGLAPQPGASPEAVPSEKVKAIFFMLAPGEKAPVPEGKKVRVTFRDGRQVAGFSPDYRDDGVGFFMIPGDTRTNTGRIWVYRAAVRQVSVT